MTTWTTNDGRVLEIRWMQSQHLVHSFNMLVRKNYIDEQQAAKMYGKINLGVIGGANGFKVMYEELHARGLYKWRDDSQLFTLVPRETPAQLCMLRAIIDTKPKDWENIVDLFMQNPDSYIEHVLTCADPKWRLVRAKFTEYRLERV